MDVWTDASYRRTVQRAGIGVVVKKRRASDVLYQASIEIPFPPGVNNAEYLAMLHAAEWCVENRVHRAFLHTDSAVLARQIEGSYRVKDVALQALYLELVATLKCIPAWIVQKIGREHNHEADALAGLATDRGKKVVTDGA